jgi:glutathione-regulated potassium-efflux system ancillary protein KefG
MYMPRILILFAHPMVEKSRVQRALLEAASSVDGVTIQDLYEQYPDFDIDIRREQELLSEHDVVILQHPFYWYSCPALMKQWIDLVLEHGWAYGRQGKALEGKKMGNVISMGGSADAYSTSGLNRHAVREFLIPFEQTALLCKMDYLPPFVVHGTHRATEDDIRRNAEAYVSVLKSLRDGRVSDDALRNVQLLNDVAP